MKVSELQDKIGLTPFNKLYDKETEGVFISDMVSDIVAGAKANDILLTIQTHKNLIATANLVDISAIVLVRGKSPLFKSMHDSFSCNLLEYRQLQAHQHCMRA